MKSLLSEVDKWSQKYTWYRKITVISLVILIISIVIFFLNFSSLLTSTVCLMISFIAVLAIRIGLSKMDEFKSLYVNTVPMIDPEKDFKEGQTSNETQGEETMTEDLSEVPELDPQLLMEAKPLAEESGVAAELTDFLNQDQIDEGAILDQVDQIEETLEGTQGGMTLNPKDLDSEVKANETQCFADVDEPVLSELEETVSSSDSEVFTSESQDTVNDNPLSLEEQVFEAVRILLRQNHCNVEALSFKTVSHYLTIYVKKRVLMRVKLMGRKQYVLTYLSQSEVESLGLSFEAPAKSEAYTSRVKFTSIAVLAQLESQIVYMYNRIEK